MIQIHLYVCMHTLSIEPVATATGFFIYSYSLFFCNKNKLINQKKKKTKKKQQMIAMFFSLNTRKTR